MKEREKYHPSRQLAALQELTCASDTCKILALLAADDVNYIANVLKSRTPQTRQFRGFRGTIRSTELRPNLAARN
jgi:hypothetical protein